MWRMAAVLLLCLFATGLLQCVRGSSQSFNDISVEHPATGLQDLNEITQSLKQGLLELVNTVGDVTSEQIQLNARLDRVQERCLSEDLKHHVTVLNEWDFKSCVNLTEACVDAEKVFVNGFRKGWNSATDLGNVIMDLLNCPSINPITAIKCYNKNFGLLKKIINDNKVWIKTFFFSAKNSLFEIRYEFDMCVGLPAPSWQIIKSYLDGIPNDCLNKF